MKSQLLLAIGATMPLLATAQSQAAPAAKPATKPAAKPAAKPAPAKPAAPAIDAKAKGLLDRSTKAYSALAGLHYNVTSHVGKETRTGVVDWKRPQMLHIELKSGDNAQKILVDGTSMYVVEGTDYRKRDAPTSTSEFLGASTFGATGSFLGSMLGGKSPLTFITSQLGSLPAESKVKITLASLPDTMIDNETLTGARLSFNAALPGGRGMLTDEETMWFDPTSAMLRRVQSRQSLGGRQVMLASDVLTQNQANPTFADTTFKFDDTGLKLASEQDEDVYWSPDLKVGGDPFAFEETALDGTKISPANFKGKVLLLDFWATWCGPCVASLPEVKATYDKYHSQGLEIVGISLDSDKTALTNFTKKNKMAWPQIFDGKEWQSKVPNIYGVKAIPFMLLIGKDGKIAALNPRENIDGAVKAALAAS